MYITWQTVLTFSAVLAAVFAILKYYNKGYDWVTQQKKQDAEIQAIKEEQQILTRGILACLKGLQEQGCDGDVTQTIGEIEEHLNAKAHT